MLLIVFVVVVGDRVVVVVMDCVGVVGGVVSDGVGDITVLVGDGVGVVIEYVGGVCFAGVYGVVGIG